MKENDNVKQVRLSDLNFDGNLLINIADITSVFPKRDDGKTVVQLRYGASDNFFIFTREEKIAIEFYFKIMKYIQAYNKNKFDKDYLVLVDDEPYLLSELELIED